LSYRNRLECLNIRLYNTYKKLEDRNIYFYDMIITEFKYAFSLLKEGKADLIINQ